MHYGVDWSLRDEFQPSTRPKSTRAEVKSRFEGRSGPWDCSALRATTVIADPKKPAVALRVRPEGRSQEVRVVVIYKLFEPKVYGRIRIKINPNPNGRFKRCGFGRRVARPAA